MREDPFSFRSLLRAADLCSKNVAWKENVSLWMNDKVKNCLELERQLKDGTYKMSDPIVFHITDPKPRTISAMRYRDRVVQRSLCENGLYEDLTRDLIYDNCACQKGKGISFAIDRLKHHIHRYYNTYHTNEGYVIRLDIRKYFPSLPHSILKDEVSRRVQDARVVTIVNDIIDEQVKIKCDDDLSFNNPSFGVRGIGLGSQISQLLALAYLSDLDHYITENIHDVFGYMRYMDDMIMFIHSKDSAETSFSIISDFIEQKGLKLNPKSHISRLSNPIEFLKVVFTLSTSGRVKFRVVRKNINRELKSVRKKISRFKRQRLSYFDLLQHTNTWFGYARERCSPNQIRLISSRIKKSFSDFKRIPLPMV